MYLAGYISADVFRLGVFNPQNKNLAYGLPYPYKEDFILQDTLVTFLDSFWIYLEKEDQAGEDEIKKIEHTVIAAGGPTGGEEIKISHVGLNLVIRVDEISKVMEDQGHSPTVSLLNDFEALAHGILYFDAYGFTATDLEPLSGSFKDIGTEEGTKIKRKIADEEKRVIDKSLVIGPDKGLGIAAVAYGAEWNGLPYIETSEGGHSTFSPEWEDAVKLVQYIQKIQSNEDLLSHRGIKEIYNYFLFERENSPNYKVTYREIIASAFSGNDTPAVSTVRFFCEALGALCGNMANIFNCNYAVFLWSQTLAEIQSTFLSHYFQKRFSARPRHGEIIGEIPVFVIKNKDFPLFGCAYYSECHIKNTIQTSNHERPSKVESGFSASNQVEEDGLKKDEE